MWRIVSPFSAWVLPLRLFSVMVFLYAFLRMLAAPDLTLMGVVVIGALLWQAGTAAQEHSPLYRRLESTAIKEMMRTRPVRVPSWMSVSRFRSEHPDLGSDVFIVTKQDIYDCGILTPQDISRVPDEAARYTSLAQVAHPLAYVHGLRMDDPVLEAFLRYRHGNHALLPVLDRREALAGVVAVQDIHRWLNNNGPGIWRLRNTPINMRENASERRLAA